MGVLPSMCMCTIAKREQRILWTWSNGELGAAVWVPGTNLNPLQKQHILWRAYPSLQSQTMLFKKISIDHEKLVTADIVWLPM